MGMDVFGKKATSETGKYFRNNVWWWRPLANYILEVAPKTLTSKCQAWHMNDGAGLGAGDSKKLATFLQEEVASGRTAVYAQDYEARIKGLQPIPCEICEGTGKRTDAIGRAARKADPKYKCNSCDGKKTVPNFETNYPFSVENVMEFIAFLKDCGGFKIC
jgi:hypothetical protein